jgi:hypothetical protein
MEQISSGNNEQEAQRPHLDIDLSGPDGNVFMVIGIARRQLDGEALKEFNRTIWEATQQGSNITYDGILAVVNIYTDLLDTSNMYPQYGPQAHITAAIDQLNARLQMLPPNVSCDIAGLYPEFDDPDLGPDKYGVLLDEEIERVEIEVGRCAEDERASLLELRTHLLACVASLKRAAVEW